MTSDEQPGRLAAIFRHFAEHEFADSSPRYAALAAAVADHPKLARPLLAAPPGQRLPILLFAAVRPRCCDRRSPGSAATPPTIGHSP